MAQSVTSTQKKKKKKKTQIIKQKLDLFGLTDYQCGSTFSFPKKNVFENL